MTDQPNFDEPTWSVGGPIDAFRLSLNLYGDDLDPAEVTAILGVEPDGAVEKGLPTQPGGRYPATTGHWWLEIDAARPDEVDEKLGELLDRLPKDLEAWRALQVRFKADLRLGLFLDSWNRGFGLSPKVQRRILELDVAVLFDIYGPFTDSDDPPDWALR